MKQIMCLVTLLIVGPVAFGQRSNPGIKAMVEASTDIAIVEVVETNPSKAIEGARDTVRLKVIRPLLGRLVAGETFGLYYHLLWLDREAKEPTLEPLKFEKGRRYVIFLRSHVEDRREEGKRVVYELTDQWLAVLPDRPELARDIAAAIRHSLGDARGDWSEAVGTFKARLVAYRTSPSNDTPIIAVYLDLYNVTGGNNTSEFNLDKALITWKVTETNGTVLAPTSLPGNWLESPRKLVLESGQSGRLRLSKTGAGIAKNDSGHLLDLGPDRVWVFKEGNEKAYYLRGKVNIAATGAREKWYGTIDLPSVRIPIKSK